MDTTTRTPDGTSGAGSDDAFAACLNGIGALLDDVAGVGVWKLGEDVLRERLAQALAVRSRVDALAARLMGSVTDRELPRLDGACSAVSWLTSSVWRLSRADAARLVAGASVFATGPGGVDGAESTRVEATRAAWGQGVVTGEQARLIAGTIAKIGRDLDEASVTGLQTELIGHAGELSFTGLQAVCAHAFEVIDPDSADARLAALLDAEEQRAREQTSLSFYAKAPGLVGFRGALPQAQYLMFKTALDAHSSPRHLARTDTTHDDGHDDATGTGTESLGRQVRGHDRRLGQALLELIEHLPTDRLARHGGVNATLVLTMSLDKLQAGVGAACIGDTTLLSAGEVRRLACGANLIPAVLGSDSQVLDLGRRVRLFTPAQRLAFEVRDKGCVFPGCDRSPGWCESHHLDTWATGGPSDHDNGCLVCGFHHRLLHSDAGWCARMGADHVVEFIPPARIDPHQRPIRHERFTAPLRT